MKEQVLLICKDNKLTLQEIDECFAVMVNFYGWDIKEFLRVFCNDIDKSTMPDYRIRAIEYYALSDKEKKEANTFRRISRLPLCEIDEKLGEHIQEWIEFLEYLQEFEGADDLNANIISFRRFLNDEDFVLAVAEENNAVRCWQDVERNLTHWLYTNDWWLDEVCEKATDPEHYPNLYWYVLLARNKNILPTYNFEDKVWEWAEENKQKWDNK
jgi:hypothetical protein